MTLLKDRQVLGTFLSQLEQVDESVLHDYIAQWESFELDGRVVMTHEGSIERYMYFVLDGIQKSYYLRDGKEHIIAFTYFPSLSGIPESFLSQQPSRYFLSTINKSRFLRISYEKHQQMLIKHPPLERLFRKATELLLIDILHRYYEMMAFDMETRFKTFTQRSPHLLQMLSQKDIASYLKIDPSNFSKLINRIKI